MYAVPFLHDLEATNRPDMSAPGNLGNRPLHLCPNSTIEHPRRVLEVHQANVDPIPLHQADAKPRSAVRP